MRRLWFVLIWITLGISALPDNLQAQLVINELCASNDSVIEDEFGESSDWIEIYNAGESIVQLEGYYLSDDPAVPFKWAFPAAMLAPEQWLLVFASDRDVAQTYLHTNFKLSAGGESVVLTKADGTTVDEINFPELAEDQSMGRLQDGSSALALFVDPTPGTSNNDTSGSGFTARPEWVTEGHFFPGTQAVAIAHPDPAADVYFTRDGSVPGTDDELYTGPITLDTTTALRVMAIAPGKLSSPVVSRTFFIDVPRHLPVISVLGDPEDFWSWERGILVHGGPNASEEWPFYGANYWSEEEYPIHTEFFTEEGELGIAFEADTKVHGGRGARTNPMKAIRILVKKKYGSSTVDYPFFEDRERTTYKRLVLRNASGDYHHGHFRDAFLARYFIKSGLNIDVLAHRPVALYINGDFYGVANLREKSDAYYLRHNFGVDIDEVDLLEEDTAVVEGSFEIFNEMLDYVLTNDLSNDINFEQAAAYFDVKNIAEGFVVQSTLNNADWLRNNIKFWRERRPEARWRYLIFDMDIAMGRHGWSRYERNNLDTLLNPLAGNNKHVDLFLQLLENDEYRYYFINRYADLLNTIFRPDIFRKEVDLTVAEIEPEMPHHFERWGWPGYDRWIDERVPVIYEYLENRPDYAREDIRDYFSLPNEVTLRLQTNPPGAGSIQISTIEPETLPWEGVYFNEVPVQLTVKPNPGFTFDHWESSKTITSPDPAANIRYVFAEDDEIVAHFSGGPREALLETFVQADGTLHAGLSLPAADQVGFSIYDFRGRLLQSYLPTDFTAGYHERQFVLPELPAGMYILQAQGKVHDVSGKFAILR